MSSNSSVSSGDPTIGSPNSLCLSNRTGISKDNKTSWTYSGSPPSLRSSLTIFAGSLQSNRTYQFSVYIENLQNNSVQATGYVLVKVEDAHRQIIGIA